MQHSKQDIYNTIRNKVLDMEFGINQHINSINLATQLGVSRTIVREILLKLSAEDIIRQESQKGFFTHSVCPNEIKNLLELRLALEIMTTKLATQRASDSELQQLLIYAKKTIKYTPPEYTLADMILYDEKFHMQIAKMSDNMELVKQLQRLNQRIRLIRWIHSQTINLPARKQHIYIADAMVKREENKAVRHMTQHISKRINMINQDLSQRSFWGRPLHNYKQ